MPQLAFLRLRRGVEILCSAFLAVEGRFNAYLLVCFVGIPGDAGHPGLGNLSIAFTAVALATHGDRTGRRG